MRSLKVAIATACLALAATSFTPASAEEQFELPASVDSSLDFLSLSALPIYGPVIAYMVCASESSPGMPPGHCLREALAVSGEASTTLKPPKRYTQTPAQSVFWLGFYSVYSPCAARFSTVMYSPGGPSAMGTCG